MKNFDEFQKILEVIEKSPGHKIRTSSRILEISFKLMALNFGHLQKFIENVPFFNSGQKEHSEKFQIEALRLFVNFLNSAVAFKEHTRNYVKEIHTDPKVALGKDYQTKIEAEFAADPLTGFIEVMRNVYDHQKIVPIGFLTTFPKNEPVTRVVIFKNELVAEYSIDTKAKKFLEGSGETIDVLNICDTYINKTIFPWLMAQEAIACKKELADINELYKKAAKLLND